MIKGAMTRHDKCKRKSCAFEVKREVELKILSSACVGLFDLIHYLVGTSIERFGFFSPTTLRVPPSPRMGDLM
jgi:hypothetical protein